MILRVTKSSGVVNELLLKVLNTFVIIDPFTLYSQTITSVVKQLCIKVFKRICFQ